MTIACQHPSLSFHSGDYYVACQSCGAKWGRLSRDGRAEYGTDRNDKPIGCDPTDCKGFVNYSAIMVPADTK
jgi:hypothetical protein